MSGPQGGSAGQWWHEPGHGLEPHRQPPPPYGYQDPGRAESQYEMQPYPTQKYPPQQYGSQQYGMQPYPPQQPIYVQVAPAPSRSNGCGTAGFVLALVGLLATLLSGGLVLLTGPILLVIWALGLLLSFIGIFKAPRGLAIAGIVLSLLPVLFVVMAGGLLAAFLGALT